MKLGARVTAGPCASNDNPFSQNQFKTLKYRPAFIQPVRRPTGDARGVYTGFFEWCNKEPRREHSL